MKKLVLFVILFVPVMAQAQVYKVNFDVENVFYQGQSYTTIWLDLELVARYYNAVGVATTMDNLSAPINGSCFITAAGGLLCNLNSATAGITLDLNSELVGQVTVSGPDGEAVATSSIRYSDWQPATQTHTQVPQQSGAQAQTQPPQ